MLFNFRYRLLCEKFGSTVYKIPDDLWERNYQQFQVREIVDIMEE